MLHTVKSNPLAHHKNNTPAALKKRLWVVLLLSALLPLVHAQYSSTPVVQTTAGPVSGILKTESRIQVFKGVPFAAPPVGDLRWKAPQPLNSWSNVKQCTAFGASAIQPAPVPFYLWSQEFITPATPLSEDCLYLNVWTSETNEKKPVLVWIHGGGFTGGSGAVPVYDGEAMAKKGVVFVTINYRLGVFGFLAHPGLSKESNYQASGNYALLDQIAALQWVKDNIAAFGGDPQRVTIAGQSAGAQSVCALMASPLATGLFSRAIAQSGGMFDVNGRLQQLKEAEQAGLQLSTLLNAPSIADLRALPAAALLEAAGSISSPVIDGHVLPADIYSIFQQGKQNDVPLLTGWNTDEGFAPQFPLNAERFTQNIQKKYGAFAPQLLKAFPAGSDEEAAVSQKSMSRDQFFAWQNYTWATLQAATGKQQAWLYVFNKKPAGEPDNGAFHSAEVPYALHNLNVWNRPWKAADKKLEELMSTYWVNFAATGNPNAAGLPEWPAAGKEPVKVMDFSSKSSSSNNPLKTEMEVLNKYQATLRTVQKN